MISNWEENVGGENGSNLELERRDRLTKSGLLSTTGRLGGRNTAKSWPSGMARSTSRESGARGPAAVPLSPSVRVGRCSAPTHVPAYSGQYKGVILRLATFATAGTEAHAGVVIEDAVLDLSVAAPSLPADWTSLLAAGHEALDLVRDAVRSGTGRVALSDVVLQAPVRPRKFFAVGLNYADHVAESGLETPANLTVFTKAVSCVGGPYDDVELPVVSNQLDYEGELGFVIGRRCRHVTAARASEVIAGYLVVNDVSVRDWQTMTQQWTLGKSFDTHGPIGPWIVTGDEVGDPHELDIMTTVNGDIRQRSNTRNLIFNCYRQVEVLSKVCTLEPGDVIATGTPSGVAMAREGQPWLVPGDRVRVDIQGIGAIENTVVREVVVDGGDAGVLAHSAEEMRG